MSWIGRAIVGAVVSIFGLCCAITELARRMARPAMVDTGYMRDRKQRQRAAINIALERMEGRRGAINQANVLLRPKVSSFTTTQSDGFRTEGGKLSMSTASPRMVS